MIYDSNMKNIAFIKLYNSNVHDTIIVKDIIDTGILTKNDI